MKTMKMALGLLALLILTSCTISGLNNGTPEQRRQSIQSMRQEVLDSIIRGIPAGRMGRPEEIAAIVSFLSSEKAGFINGASVTANGGQYMV